MSKIRREHRRSFERFKQKELELLLKRIMSIWPDVKFITSAELGEIIENE